MRLNIGHGLSFDLQTISYPHVAVDFSKTSLIKSELEIGHLNLIKLYCIK